jgi:hypothetical protein
MLPLLMIFSRKTSAVAMAAAGGLAALLICAAALGFTLVCAVPLKRLQA